LDFCVIGSKFRTNKIPNSNSYQPYEKVFLLETSIGIWRIRRLRREVDIITELW